MKNNLCASKLRQRLKYDENTGIFEWISLNKYSDKIIGKTAGCKSANGYLVVGIDGFRYTCHRLAWLYVYGEWPNGLVDHINGKKDDNRISNLRVISKAANAINSDVVLAKSGMRGVYYQSNTKKWRVKCGNVNVGYFDTKDEASAAYRDTARRLYGDVLRG